MLSDLYENRKVPEKEQIRNEKNIIFIVPSKDFPLEQVLVDMGLSRYEVAVTWPKEFVTLQEEIDEINPILVIQIDCSFLDNYESIESTKASEYQLTSDVITDGFVGIHHHDEFSLKDGLGTVDQITKLLKAQRRSFCCITNHGNIGGWIKQHNACRKMGIKAIYGMESYVSNYRGDDPAIKKAHRHANHLVLVARTKEGFDNIIRIHNDAQLNGFYYSPRANRDAFQKWGKGIVATSACMAGEIPQALMAGDKDKAKELYEFYKTCFDRFYIELQIIEYEAQREVNRRLIEFAGEVGAPLILACDSHYLKPEHADTHDLLMCIRQHKTVLDKVGEDEEGESDVWNFDVRNLYYRNSEQMYEVFDRGFIQKDGTQHSPFRDDVFTDEVFFLAMDNTRLLALDTEDIKLDSAVKLPRLYPNSNKTLRQKIITGFKGRGLDFVPNKQEYVDRLKMEFDIITKKGFADYFLVVEKIVTDSKEKYGEWAVGPGRGSSAGSLVSYCLRITDIDPIEYDLLFERFIDEGREDYPDIDLDFDPRIRDWVKDHVVELFGKDNVCSIGTYSTYRTRAVILDVARALGEDLSIANQVTKGIDPLKSFEDEDGEDTKVDNMSFDDLCRHYPELDSYFASYPMVRFHAEVLRNQVKNMGTHAGGVIISDTSFQDRIPILYDKVSSDERKIISAWAESGSTQELSAVGIVKYDILGLKNLPIISDCIKLVEKTKGIKLKRSQIPISDKESIFFGGKKDLVGIFQLQNPSTMPVIEAVGMESLHDVAAVTSLIRPGPMDAEINGIKAPYEYARRKKGEYYEAPEFLKEVLAKTYGIMVYQEDVMKMSRVLSGFTASEANKLRKAAGKKIKEMMQSMRDKFVQGSQVRIEKGEITVEEVEEIWSQIETFAGYGFCVSWDTVVETPDGLRLLSELKIGDKVKTPTCLGGEYANVTDIWDRGEKELYEVTLESGKSIKCTIDHELLCGDGKKRSLGLIIQEGHSVVCEV